MEDQAKTLVITVEEAARQLGISRSLAYQAAREGEIPTVRVGRRLLVPRAALERMLDAADTSTRAQADGQHALGA